MKTNQTKRIIPDPEELAELRVSVTRYYAQIGRNINPPRNRQYVKDALDGKKTTVPEDLIKEARRMKKVIEKLRTEAA